MRDSLYYMSLFGKTTINIHYKGAKGIVKLGASSKGKETFTNIESSSITPSGPVTVGDRVTVTSVPKEFYENEGIKVFLSNIDI